MERTCVACRGVKDPEHLIRLVADPEGRVVPDLGGRLPGRGAWTCPTVACVGALEARPAMLSRALHAEVDPAGLLARVRAVVSAATRDALGVAARAGCVRGGADLIARLGPSDRVVALVVAADAASRSVEAARARHPEVPMFRLSLDRADLGAATGKGLRAVLAVSGGAPSTRLLRMLRREAGLG